MKLVYFIIHQRFHDTEWPMMCHWEIT